MGLWISCFRYYVHVRKSTGVCASYYSGVYRAAASFGGAGVMFQFHGCGGGRTVGRTATEDEVSLACGR